MQCVCVGAPGWVYVCMGVDCCVEEPFEQQICRWMLPWVLLVFGVTCGVTHVASVTTSLALVVPCCSSEYVAVCHWWNDHRTPDQDAALLEWALALAKDRRIPVAGLPPRALRVTVRGCTSCASCVVACGGCCAGCSAPHASSACASRDRPRTMWRHGCCLHLPCPLFVGM